MLVLKSGGVRRCSTQHISIKYFFRTMGLIYIIITDRNPLLKNNTETKAVGSGGKVMEV